METARPATTREERQRRRTRALVAEVRRALITELKAFERYLAEEDADDAGGVAIVPGDGQHLPRSGNRPPAIPHR